MKILKGDITLMPFNVVGHGCNCMCVQGAGIAKTFSQLYGTLDYPMEKYRQPSKLGHIEGFWNEAHQRWVYNMYTQISPGPNAHLEMVVQTVSELVKRHPNDSIGIPLIGAGIGGLDPVEVIKSLLSFDITLVLYDPITL